jgi:hypothetical protein
MMTTVVATAGTTAEVVVTAGITVAVVVATVGITAVAVHQVAVDQEDKKPHFASYQIQVTGVRLHKTYKPEAGNQ